MIEPYYRPLLDPSRIPLKEPSNLKQHQFAIILGLAKAPRWHGFASSGCRGLGTLEGFRV